MGEVLRITSRRNPKVQWVRRLQRQAKARREAQAWVAEGVRLGEEAWRARAAVQAVFFEPSLPARGRALVQSWADQGVPVYQVTAAVMEALSATASPPGLLVVLAQRPRPWPAHPTFVFIVDSVRDPGNLGTLLRTAWAAGVHAVAVVGSPVDPWSPKVVRAGMGAHFHVPLWVGDWAGLAPRLRGLTVYLAAMQGEVAYPDADFRAPVALVVGGEAHGPSEEARQHAQRTVYIPMPGRAESLNAAVAGGILLFEVARQRHWRP